jgi:serine/threonine protein kinase
MNNSVYALKVMDKSEIISKKMTKGVMREKNVMASVEHPFISNLVSSFQDKQQLYMLMSYVQGGELFGLIYNVSKKGYLSNDAAAFYGACLVEALAHLHSRNICHRDLKPENILINRSGYVVLVDFGFAKVVLDKTFTTCGSPEYMAPEILLGKGHSESVDHWALGVVLYEMLVGQTPFIHVGATKMTLFRRICNSTFAFPNPKKHGIYVSDEAKSLIKGLLSKKSSERIGSSLTLGDEEISTNPFFRGLLTEYRTAFLSEKVAPPWLPDIDNELDASYFGSHDKAEKEVRSRKREDLDKKSQRLFEGF